MASIIIHALVRFSLVLGHSNSNNAATSKVFFGTPCTKAPTTVIQGVPEKSDLYRNRSFVVNLGLLHLSKFKLASAEQQQKRGLL
jgi:hypothetical protein